MVWHSEACIKNVEEKKKKTKEKGVFSTNGYTKLTSSTFVLLLQVSREEGCGRD